MTTSRRTLWTTSIVVKRYNSYFNEAAWVVLLEIQMSCNVRIIESVIHALYYDACIVMSP
ncbi:MAG: hypothetical protein SGPRY_007254 [Prymnesium sp.]